MFSLLRNYTPIPKVQLAQSQMYELLLTFISANVGENIKSEIADTIGRFSGN